MQAVAYRQHCDKTWQNTTRAVGSCLMKQNLIMKESEDIQLKKDIALAQSQTSDNSDTLMIAKTAKILRKHTLDHQSRFDCTSGEGCINDAIPQSLLQFTSMVEHGTDIKSQLRFGSSKSDLAIAQLLQYNCFSRQKEGASVHRHSKDRETPFPVFMGMPQSGRETW
ncbi:uncharacterized protein [Macrobrachium rosenbergii]|uniref:uncharacterized protein n=1 Tax=Macrobrachium rosenbergii TaxID=79674 RepID=UPI0034D6707D